MKKILYIMFALVVMVSCDKKDEASIMGTASATIGTNDDGTPIVVLSGITVKLYSEGTQLLSSTETDGEGSFSFTGLESGNYFVGATITIDGTVWDTGNTPPIVYVSDEIVKEVALTLNAK